LRPAVAGLAEIVLWVHDMDHALHFYRDLFGLEVIPHPDPAVGFPREKAKRVLHHLAFRVEGTGYDELKDRLEAEGLEVRSGIHSVLKGVRTFYVDDPDGNECECICPDPDYDGPRY